MQLFVRGLSRTHAVNIDVSCSVADLKALLNKLENIEVGDQVISCAEHIFEDDGATLASLGVQSASTLDLSSRLFGGKVHGSLARAGKVRGQTPKVDKKEKRRKPTGRAKRRLQYTRRFVNVVVGGPGRRRGPNSNMK